MNRTWTAWDVWTNIMAGVVFPTILASMIFIYAFVPPSPSPSPNPNPNPPAPVVDTTTIGRSYGATLAHTYADAWDQAAKDVESGTPIPAVQIALQTAWKADRTTAFTKQVAPTFEAIIPEGTEGDTVSRRQWAKAAREFASGLRGVK